MKVYEIITESKDLEEGWLDKAFGAVAGKATRAATRKVAQKAATKAANAKALGQFGKLPALAKAGVVGKVAASGAVSIAPWAIHALNAWNIYGVFRTYNENVDAWDEKLQADVAAGKLTEEKYKEQIAAIRRTEMGLLIPKVAAGLVGSVAIRALPSGIGMFLKRSDNPVVKGLGHTISGLGRVGSAYLYSKINSPEGSDAFAKVLTGTALGDWVTGTIGETGVAAVNFVKGVSDNAAKVDSGKPVSGNGQGGSDTKVDKPAADKDNGKGEERYSMPNNAPAEPATAASKEYAPPGYTRDAKGNLIHTGD